MRAKRITLYRIIFYFYFGRVYISSTNIETIRGNGSQSDIICVCTWYVRQEYESCHACDVAAANVNIEHKEGDQKKPSHMVPSLVATLCMSNVFKMEKRKEERNPHTHTHYEHLEALNAFTVSSSQTDKLRRLKQKSGKNTDTHSREPLHFRYLSFSPAVAGRYIGSMFPSFVGPLLEQCRLKFAVHSALGWLARGAKITISALKFMIEPVKARQKQKQKRRMEKKKCPPMCSLLFFHSFAEFLYSHSIRMRKAKRTVHGLLDWVC